MEGDGRRVRMVQWLPAPAAQGQSLRRKCDGSALPPQVCGRGRRTEHSYRFRYTCPVMFVAWIALAAAIASEIAATLSLKPAGHGSLAAIALVVVGYVASFALMLVVLRRMEVSVAYAI